MMLYILDFQTVIHGGYSRILFLFITRFFFSHLQDGDYLVQACRKCDISRVRFRLDELVINCCVFLSFFKPPVPISNVRCIEALIKVTLLSPHP